jgi:RNA polymerase sigma-70 factor (ECF subfamily)
LDNQVHNEKSFEAFFRKYHAAALRYCQTIVMDRDEAEDIVQKVFVSLWRVKQSGFPDAEGRAYLYRSVYNASLDFLKHQKVKQAHAKETMATRSTQIVLPEGEQRELQQLIHRSLDALPEPCRKIFMLNRFENLKYREIAAKLSLPEKKVENQMGKALKILRESLREHLPLLFTIILLHHD